MTTEQLRQMLIPRLRPSRFRRVLNYFASLKLQRLIRERRERNERLDSLEDLLAKHRSR